MFPRSEQLELGRAFFADRRDTDPAFDDAGGAAAQTLLHYSTVAIGRATNRDGAAAQLMQRRHRETFSAWIA